MPINTAPIKFAPPDLILTFTIAFVLRHPNFASPVLIGLTLLFCDFVLQRPPGLWALMVFCVSIVLRARASELKETFFGAEWLTAAIGVTSCYVFYYFALIFTFLPSLNLPLAALQAILTVLCYPIAVWILHILLPKLTVTGAETMSTKVSR